MTEPLYHAVKGPLDESHEELVRKLSEFGIEERTLEMEQLRRVRRRLVDVKKARLAELWREGLLSDSSYEVLLRELDGEIDASQSH